MLNNSFFLFYNESPWTYKTFDQILDFRSEVPAEGFKSFEMPLLEGQKERFSPYDIARINNTSFLVLKRLKSGLRVFKITV